MSKLAAQRRVSTSFVQNCKMAVYCQQNSTDYQITKKKSFKTIGSLNMSSVCKVGIEYSTFTINVLNTN